DFVTVLGPGDRLARGALAHLEQAAMDSSVDVLYSDGDSIGPRGQLQAPSFKPGWDPEMLAWPGYLDRLVAFRTARARAVGGFRGVAAEVYDLALRCAATGHVRHV